MSYKRSIDELDIPSVPTLAKRKVDDVAVQSVESESITQSSRRLTADLNSTMDSDSEDECDTDPSIIMPYLDRFQESYESSLEIYSSRLDKLELSDALKCTNDLFSVAIDNYTREHNGFAHKTQMDLSGVQNVRREFDQLVDGQSPCRQSCPHSIALRLESCGQCPHSTANRPDSCGQCIQLAHRPESFLRSSHNNSYDMIDDKLAKVLSYMCAIESKICADMRRIYLSYEKLLSDLVLIEYRLSIIIEMFHHMTDIEPQKFLPSLPYMQNVPDLIGYINSLYDQENELSLREESNNERMQAIVNQFRAMHKRIRDAMDGLHALSCIIMEKKTEVIDRVHTFYKKAEQIFFSEPSFMFQSKDTTSRCL